MGELDSNQSRMESKASRLPLQHRPSILVPIEGLEPPPPLQGLRSKRSVSAISPYGHILVVPAGIEPAQ